MGTKWLGAELQNTLQQVYKLTSTNGPIKMLDYPIQTASTYRNGIEDYVHDVGGKYCLSSLVYG